MTSGEPIREETIDGVRDPGGNDPGSGRVALDAPVALSLVGYSEPHHKYALIAEIVIRGSLAEACRALQIEYGSAYRAKVRDAGGAYDWDLLADEYRRNSLAADSKTFMHRIKRAVDRTMDHVETVLDGDEYDFKNGVWSEVERMVKTVRLLQDKSTDNIDVRAALSRTLDEFKRLPDEQRAEIIAEYKQRIAQ